MEKRGLISMGVGGRRGSKCARREMGARRRFQEWLYKWLLSEGKAVGRQFLARIYQRKGPGARRRRLAGAERLPGALLFY